MKKVAIDLRVSTDSQTTDNQRRELEAVAARSGWQMVKVYEDAGISGAKGRDKRPGLDAMMKAVNAKELQMVAAWSVDRLGRSLTDLLAILQALHDKGVDLFLHQQGLDTSTTAGRAMFQMFGVSPSSNGGSSAKGERRPSAGQGEGDGAWPSADGAGGREAHTAPSREGNRCSEDRPHVGYRYKRCAAAGVGAVAASRRHGSRMRLSRLVSESLGEERAQCTSGKEGSLLELEHPLVPWPRREGVARGLGWSGMARRAIGTART
jgi:Resolvase, N terminal domain